MYVIMTVMEIRYSMVDKFPMLEQVDFGYERIYELGAPQPVGVELWTTALTLQRKRRLPVSYRVEARETSQVCHVSFMDETDRKGRNPVLYGWNWRPMIGYEAAYQRRYNLGEIRKFGMDLLQKQTAWLANYLYNRGWTATDYVPDLYPVLMAGEFHGGDIEGAHMEYLDSMKV